MTLLQPGDVPSRMGINNAITSEIAAAHGESSVLVCPDTHADINGNFNFKLILGGRLGLFWFSFTIVNAISIPVSGDIADKTFTSVSGDYRPAQYLLLGGRTVGTGSLPCWFSFNTSGYLAFSRVDAINLSPNPQPTIPVGETITGNGIYIPVGQDA
jgi:hypothetical protein